MAIDEAIKILKRIYDCCRKQMAEHTCDLECDTCEYRAETEDDIEAMMVIIDYFSGESIGE